MAILSAAEFRVYYPFLEGTGEDTVIDTVIAAADGILATYCGYPPYDGGFSRSLASHTYTLYPYGPSGAEPSALCLCVGPIVSVTSVNIDPLLVYGAGTLLVAGTDYAFDALTGTLFLLPSSAYTWPVGFRTTKVVVVAGFATTPPELKAIVAAEVRHLWDLRNVQGEQAYTLAGNSSTLGDWDQLIPRAVQAALQSYRVCA